MTKQNKVAQLKKRDDKNNQQKNKHWFYRFLMSFLACIATVFVYCVVIRFVLAFMMSMVQRTVEQQGLTSDPVMFVAFSIGISSAIIGVFIAKVPVYSSIMNGGRRLVQFSQRMMNNADSKRQKQKAAKDERKKYKKAAKKQKKKGEK